MNRHALAENSGGAAAAGWLRDGGGSSWKSVGAERQQASTSPPGDSSRPHPGARSPVGGHSRPLSRGQPGGRGTAPQRQQTGRRASARPGGGCPTDTLRPPGAAAPSTAHSAALVRRAQCATRRRYYASARATRINGAHGCFATRSPSGRARRRELAAGFTAVSSAQLGCCASAASEGATGLQPWASMWAAAMEPVSAANRRRSEQSRNATPAEGASPPARCRTSGTMRRLNGAAGRTICVGGGRGAAAPGSERSERSSRRLRRSFT